MVLDIAESSTLPLVSGVPQGSNLGPMLILIYIDQAANSISNSRILMYADDIELHHPVQNQFEYMKIQQDVHSLS